MVKFGAEKLSFLKNNLELGNSIGEWAKYFGVSNVTLRMHLRREGLLDEVKRIRAEKIKISNNVHKEMNFLRGSIAGLVKDFALSKVSSEFVWAYEKAFDYESMNTKKGLDFDSSFKIYQLYKELSDANIKKSFSFIARSVGVNAMTACRVLEFGGLSSFFRSVDKKSRNIYSDRINNVLVKGDFSVFDVASFLDLSLSSVYNNVNKDVVSSFPSRRDVYFYDGKSLSFYELSEVYFGFDNGFSKDELSFVLDLSSFFVSYGLNNRDKFEPVLVDNLRVLFPDKVISKPYI
ncbi:hypothetical protein K9L97_02865 [Candidatus Woesearchaeota archaeon]|nr:hypothetical protein [Candidatus Woesearchaeota archaeon]